MLPCVLMLCLDLIIFSIKISFFYLFFRWLHPTLSRSKLKKKQRTMNDKRYLKFTLNQAFKHLKKIQVLKLFVSLLGRKGGGARMNLCLNINITEFQRGMRSSSSSCLPSLPFPLEVYMNLCLNINITEFQRGMRSSSSSCLPLPFINITEFQRGMRSSSSSCPPPLPS